jgi:hypothetical protein
LETDPYREPAALAALRFALEVFAWIAIYFAWGWPFLILAVAVLSVFSVPGDKHKVVIPISGKARIALEIIVFVAGVAGAYLVWSVPSASVVALIIAVMFVSSHRRMIFLWNR